MQGETTVVDVSQDWMTACDVQQRFMVHAYPGAHALDYAAQCRQLRALGGDCYDFLPLSEDCLGMAIADAAGKSLAAALMIANVQSSLRTAAGFVGTDARAVVGAVNRQVYASSLEDRYATLFYGVFDLASRTLRYVNAGHNPPLVIRGDRVIARLDAGGPPVGVFSDSEYEVRTFRLETGDVFVAYTDGVAEALNFAGKEWGINGLEEAAIQSDRLSSEEIVAAIFGALDGFSRGQQADDATVAVMRVR